MAWHLPYSATCSTFAYSGLLYACNIDSTTPGIYPIPVGAWWLALSAWHSYAFRTRRAADGGGTVDCTERVLLPLVLHFAAGVTPHTALPVPRLRAHIGWDAPNQPVACCHGRDGSVAAGAHARLLHRPTKRLLHYQFNWAGRSPPLPLFYLRRCGCHSHAAPHTPRLRVALYARMAGRCASWLFLLLRGYLRIIASLEQVADS